MSSASPHYGGTKGERAEHVSNWYFRLNGFLSIPGFVIHPDHPSRYPRTEADLIGVRFPNSTEVLDGVSMMDDPKLSGLCKLTKTLFVLVEVKTELCSINGPWSDPLHKTCNE